ncbi:tripartite tricarboxylate transporter substrate binding protein [Roseomonas hellenica]|uniref:Tripartite tricarboxylate transporter substrate binding protein n=1 Tax=Plastoroseomonas hellenica TaxID=2687306 RepID=A0ABS5F1L7_9PROT|nr:tripartite tricarboxylate transporter substrate binding protein [Plastoroseomonas hellenica]MBR0666449.1 tripartite tricarboxylate transporter substrate binding protein [Plastoroseomonas hellenica]
MAELISSLNRRARAIRPAWLRRTTGGSHSGARHESNARAVGIARRVLLGTAAALAGGRARAQSYPDRPLRLIVPWAPGGSTDVLARLVAVPVGEALGQPVIVDNRPGASGTIGHASVARAAPDGHTVLMATNSTFAIAPYLLPSLPYAHDEAFAPVALLAETPLVLAVKRGGPASLAALLAEARARPEALTFASGGIGVTSHMAAELLMALAGISLTHVPYRGGGPAAQALAAGEVTMAFLDPTVAKPLADGGQVGMIGTTGSRRFPSLPELPTIEETGLPRYVTITSYGLFVPRATPAPIIARIAGAAMAVLDRPGFREDMAGRGISVRAEGAEALAAHVREENARWSEVIRTRHIRMH